MADVVVENSGGVLLNLLLYRPSVGDRITLSGGRPAVVVSVGLGYDSLPGGCGVRGAVVELVERG